MIDVRHKDEKQVSEVRFEEIRIGDCFYDDDNEGLYFKIAEDKAVCLEDGTKTEYYAQDRVTEVNVEVRWEFKPV